MRYIYHITHIENLPQILQTGGLVCDARKEALATVPASIAYDDIKMISNGSGPGRKSRVGRTDVSPTMFRSILLPVRQCSLQ